MQTTEAKGPQLARPGPIGLGIRVILGVATLYCPSVRRSSPARQWTRVDLPDPDGPMMAVNRPLGRSSVTSSRATTAVSPEP
jgi:hypothetical protein